MPRHARVVVPGLPHHVTQRGNRGLDVFPDAVAYRRFVDWLADYSRRYELAVSAYCLMPNHFHLVVTPGAADALGLGMRALLGRYAQWLNHAAGTSGHVWQGRYYACPLDETHLYCAVRYVEQNPVRARLAAAAEEWPWSSAAAHCRAAPDPILADDATLPDVADWRAWLADTVDADDDLLRHRTKSGMPAGDERFVAGLERAAGRSLVVRPVGRPKTERKE